MAGPDTGVSRETLSKFDDLRALVEKWNAKINLVAPSTLPEFQTRHVADSLAVSEAVPEAVEHWADLGAGGGFPGLVVAISRPDTRVTLVESDQRKAQFLRTARRELRLNVDIQAARIEQLPPLGAQVVSARALAPLTLLLSLGSRHCVEGGLMVFPKGETWESEHLAAQEMWSYDLEVLDGSTGSSGKILKIRNARLRHGSETNN